MIRVWDGKIPVSTPKQYEANLETLIAKAKKFTTSDKLLFVGLQPCDESRTTPCSWRDTSYLNERLRLFDAALRQTCRKHDIAFVPIYDEFEKRQIEQDVLIDGLHPDTAGHQLIHDLVAPKLQEVLRANNRI